MLLSDKALRHRFLASCERIEEGRVTLYTPEGDRHRFGAKGPDAEMTIRDWSMVSALAGHGQVGLGESYVQGLWDTPSVESLAGVAILNRERLADFDRSNPIRRAHHLLLDRLVRANSRAGSCRNVRAHYDVGNEFYQLWLDRGMTYSSGLFANNDEDLFSAQSRKNARILSRLSEGESLLEIGCGWGAFAEQATEEGRHVTGITVSRNQHSYAEARLDGRADIRFCDYRDVRGRYDNIVSIEMVEAVGKRYWPGYFSVLKRSLADGGRVLLQAITVKDKGFERYRKTSDFIRQYIFPGGMLLSNAVIAEQAGKAGLRLHDSFDFGPHYARTCRIWARRLERQKARLPDMGFGEAFYRKWIYYLEVCAASFALGRTSVVQVELGHA